MFTQRIFIEEWECRDDKLIVESIVEDMKEEVLIVEDVVEKVSVSIHFYLLFDKNCLSYNKENEGRLIISDYVYFADAG